MYITDVCWLSSESMERLPIDLFISYRGKFNCLKVMYLFQRVQLSNWYTSNYSYQIFIQEILKPMMLFSQWQLHTIDIYTANFKLCCSIIQRKKRNIHEIFTCFYNLVKIFLQLLITKFFFSILFACPRMWRFK